MKPVASLHFPEVPNAGIFANRPTPSDCIERLSNAMSEVTAIRDSLDATSTGKGHAADWHANRKYAQEHLSEAWGGLGAALSGLMIGQRRPTWNEKVDAVVETQRRHLVFLRAEVKRLEDVLALAKSRETAAEAATMQHPPPHPQEITELADRVRRAVLGAVHPDRAANAAEEEWRTQLCHTLFPEIDRVMRDA